MNKPYLTLSNRAFRLASFFLLLVVLPLFYTSCKKSKKNEEGGGSSGTVIAGMGKSEARPEGTPLLLPTGLQLLAPIKGYSPFQPEYCDDKEHKDGKGVGDMVQICLGFRNTTGSPITITLPPGLIFISKSLESQNGILVTSVTITIPPTSVFFQPLFLCCINDGRDPAHSKDDEFELGPVTQYQKMLDLFTLLSTKNLSNRLDWGKVQSSVWTLSDGKPLTKFEQDELASIPNK